MEVKRRQLPPLQGHGRHRSKRADGGAGGFSGSILLTVTAAIKTIMIRENSPSHSIYHAVEFMGVTVGEQESDLQHYW